MCQWNIHSHEVSTRDDPALHKNIVMFYWCYFLEMWMTPLTVLIIHSLSQLNVCKCEKPLRLCFEIISHCQRDRASVLDWSKLCVCVSVCANIKDASTSGFDRTRVWNPLDLHLWQQNVQLFLETGTQSSSCIFKTCSLLMSHKWCWVVYLHNLHKVLLIK